jgi:hypothetical protein
MGMLDRKVAIVTGATSGIGSFLRAVVSRRAMRRHGAGRAWNPRQFGFAGRHRNRHLAKALGIKDASKADALADRMQSSFVTMQAILQAKLPDDITQCACWLACDRSSFINGEDVIVDGGMIRGRPFSIKPPCARPRSCWGSTTKSTRGAASETMAGARHVKADRVHCCHNPRRAFSESDFVSKVEETITGARRIQGAGRLSGMGLLAVIAFMHSRSCWLADHGSPDRDGSPPRLKARGCVEPRGHRPWPLVRPRRNGHAGTLRLINRNFILLSLRASLGLCTALQREITDAFRSRSSRIVPCSRLGSPPLPELVPSASRPGPDPADSIGRLPPDGRCGQTTALVDRRWGRLYRDGLRRPSGGRHAAHCARLGRPRAATVAGR